MANKVQCTGGHWFDMSKFRFCPYCGLPAAAVPAPVQQAAPVMPAMPPMAPVQTSAPSVNTNLPVGWLVGTSGPAKGKTYVIRENKNFIGSSSDMDIIISDDPTVAADRHAIIIYVPRLRTFYAQPGTSRELYYVNDHVILETVELSPGDVFDIGNSKLSLLPLCGDMFGWDEPEAI